MSIKYNERGEVISVNGIVTGQHIGKPLQDATPEKPEDNEPYAIAQKTETSCDNSVELWDEQPSPMGGVTSWNDLEDKPFDAKQEEIVRSIRLNASGANSARGADLTIATLLYNNPNLATVYHHGEACKYMGSIPQNNNQTTFIYGIDEVERVRININVSNGNINEDITAWFNWYADFVDIEIPDTVEIVEPIDYKFMPDGYPKAETEFVEILPEQSVTGNLNSGIYSSSEFSCEIKVGVRYDIIINETKYTDVGKTETIEDVTVSYIGNLSFLDGETNTGEPFALMAYEGQTTIGWREELGETIKFAIYEAQEVVEKLDPKFLPIHYFKNLHSFGRYSSTITYDELRDAIATDTFVDIRCVDHLSGSDETVNFLRLSRATQREDSILLEFSDGTNSASFIYESDGTLYANVS